jgi:23S rRNA (guanine745-N1)-methyltransferase
MLAGLSSDVRVPLACTVRLCGLPIEKRERVYVCGRGHTFDIARSGYVNLLQPQDRRSREPGDAREALSARAALLAADIGRTLIDAIASRFDRLNLRTDPVIVDLGSGTGDALATVAGQRSMTAIGIDLSSAAADHAARRFPDCVWVVANADRRLPLLDQSVDVVMSLHGRRNPEEAARVLRSDGALLIALPAPDDLVELRALVQGEGIARERGEAVIDAHRPLFAPVDRACIRETLTLERELLMNLLRATYRGARLRSTERVVAVDRMAVTLASDVFVFRRT